MQVLVRRIPGLVLLLLIGLVAPGLAGPGGVAASLPSEPYQGIYELVDPYDTGPGGDAMLPGLILLVAVLVGGAALVARQRGNLPARRSGGEKP